MPWCTYLCAYPPCGATVHKYHKPSRPVPQYCDHRCRGRHRGINAAFLTAVHLRTKYRFSAAMDAALTTAYRGKFGAVKQLWHTDARFERAGIPYAILMRRLRQLGLARSLPHDAWSEAESAMATRLYRRGRCVEFIADRLRQAGYTRTPSGILTQMQALQVSVRGECLTLHEIAQGLGIDWHSVRAWTTKGWLTVHHENSTGRLHFVTYAELRRFVLTYPSLVSRGTPDIVWLISVVCPPHVGHTHDLEDTERDEDGAWMSGEAVAL